MTVSASRMRRDAGVLILLLLGVSLGIPDLAQAQDPIQVLEIDSYAKTLAPGESATFNWTIRNIDAIPYAIQLEVSSAPGWLTSVNPDRIDNLSPNRAAAVVASVVAPPEIDAETVLGLTLRVTVVQDSAVVFITSRSATATVPSIYAEKRVLGVFDNPLPAPLDNEWGVFVLDVVLWLLISVAVLLVAIPLIRRLGSLTKTKVADVILRIIRTPLVALLFLYGTLQSLNALDRHISPDIRNLLFRVYDIALTLILIYLGYRLFKDVVIYIARTISQKTESHVDDAIVPIAEKLGLAIIGFAGVGLFLGALNVDLTLFVAGGVVTSMVIAFAAQDTLSNFFSGIFLLSDRPFKEGDIVILPDGDWTQVRKIGMRTTRLLRFMDASLVTIPNNTLVNEKIANFTNPQDKGRIMKTFNVAYGSDPATVKRILGEVIAANKDIIQEDPLRPIVRFDAMGESSLDFFVLVWIEDRAKRFDVTDYLNSEIYRRFNKAGIEIPFPQRTVHLRTDGQLSVPLDIQEIARRVATVNSDDENDGADPDREGG